MTASDARVDVGRRKWSPRALISKRRRSRASACRSLGNDKAGSTIDRYLKYSESGRGNRNRGSTSQIQQVLKVM